MAAHRFNTLTYANKLKEVGVDPKQAEMFAQLQEEIIENVDLNTVSTKKDINELKDELKNLEVKLTELIHSNTWKIIGLVGGLIGIQIAIQTLLHFFPK